MGNGTLSRSKHVIDIHHSEGLRLVYLKLQGAYSKYPGSHIDRFSRVDLFPFAGAQIRDV